jgi:hypothetical protein
MCLIFCAIVATMKREPLFGATLNNWDETVVYAALFSLVSSFSHSVPS